MSRLPSPGADRTAGFIAPLMPCSCGRQPIIVSIGYGLVRASCFCGKQGKNSRDAAIATEAWNHDIVERLLKAMR